MKVCLINPQRLLKPISASMKPAPSLGLAFIASVLRQNGHEVLVLDCIAEAPDTYYSFKDDIVYNGLSFNDTVARIPADTDLIGFSIMFSGNWLHNRILIDYIGRHFPNAKVIAGGEHITACPEFCIKETKELDVCVLGEGEETIVALVQAFINGDSLSEVEGICYRDPTGSPIKVQRRKRIKEITKIPRPAWDLFPLEKYRQNSIIYGVDRGMVSLPLMATRGCPYECTFCSSPQMWTTQYSMRPVEDVVDEIEEFYKRFDARNFDFYDLTAIIKKQWIIDFCKALLNRNLPGITWQIPAGTRSEAIDTEVAFWLKKSGCSNITYAPESGSAITLKTIKKKVKLNKMLESIKHTSAEGMNIKINFIIGFPNETHQDIWSSIRFLIHASKAGVNDMSPAIFSPYPGSELFNLLLSKGEINMENDSYFINIINVDTLWGSRFYNYTISSFMLKFYLIMYLVVFYGTNFIFYPKRFFKTMKNLLLQRYESRGEMALGELIKRSRVKILPKEQISPSV